MATLTIPHNFVAGTPAVASQVNENFDAIVDWANGGINTDAFGLLTARTIALPSAPLPLKTIVPIYQTAAEPALYIVNDSQGVPLTIVQNQAFGSPGKAIIRISDTTTQIQSGSPTIWLELANGATAPALLVQHGSVDTMRLTRTQLDLFNGAVQATSAGVISATIVAATDVNTTNVTTTGLLDLTAPASDAIVAEIKGRSSDNNAIVQFKSNDDATVYASATSSPSGLTLNLPDTADSYTFKVNEVTKAVIDDNGIDAQYLYGTLPSSLQESEILGTTPPLTALNVMPSSGTTGTSQELTLYTGTVSLSSRKLVTADIISGSITGANVFAPGSSKGTLEIRIVGAIRTTIVAVTSPATDTSPTPVSNLSVSVNPVILPAGTYTYHVISILTRLDSLPNRRVQNTDIVAQIYAA